MEIGKRLKILREKLGLSQSEFAKKIGTSQGYLSELERNLKKPGSDLLLSLKRLFNVSTDWLLTGEGPMFIKKPYWLEREEEAQAFAKEFGAIYVKPVPVLGYVPAGFPSEIPEDAIIEYIHLPDIPDNCYVFIAKGDSMSPLIKEGDYIVVVNNQEIVSGNIVVYQNEWGEVSVKRFRRKDNKIFLVPENPEYPTIEFDPEKHRIIGKVLKAFRPIKLD